MSRSLTTQDVSWFLDLFDKQQLNLDPPYQRRSVWSPRDRRYFIDTILNNYPAPPIFLHKTLDDNGRATYHVVDGKQRLQTIIQFRDNKIVIPAEFSDVTLQNKRWKALEKGTRERFWNYVLIVEMLPDAGEAAIRNTFERINRNSRKLTSQEMRHAKYDGWFMRAVEAEAVREEWKDFGVVTTGRAKRMADTQFISELFAVIIRTAISGFDQDDLDQMYADYDEIEENELFIEEEFYTKLSSVKEAISAMLREDPTVIEFIKSQGHFYSLWGVLTLKHEAIPPVALFAQRYRAFLLAVAHRLADQSEGRSEDNEPNRRAIADYAANIRGASTDRTQRAARHQALLSALTEAEAE
jgi:hypothetical protein